MVCKYLFQILLASHTLLNTFRDRQILVMLFLTDRFLHAGQIYRITFNSQTFSCQKVKNEKKNVLPQNSYALGYCLNCKLCSGKGSPVERLDHLYYIPLKGGFTLGGGEGGGINMPNLNIIFYG